MYKQIGFKVNQYTKINELLLKMKENKANFLLIRVQKGLEVDSKIDEWILFANENKIRYGLYAESLASTQGEAQLENERFYWNIRNYLDELYLPPCYFFTDKTQNAINLSSNQLKCTSDKIDYYTQTYYFESICFWNQHNIRPLVYIDYNFNRNSFEELYNFSYIIMKRSTKQLEKKYFEEHEFLIWESRTEQDISKLVLIREHDNRLFLYNHIVENEKEKVVIKNDMVVDIVNETDEYYEFNLNDYDHPKCDIYKIRKDVL